MRAIAKDLDTNNKHNYLISPLTLTLVYSYYKRINILLIFNNREIFTYEHYVLPMHEYVVIDRYISAKNKYILVLLSRLF